MSQTQELPEAKVMRTLSQQKKTELEDIEQKKRQAAREAEVLAREPKIRELQSLIVANVQDAVGAGQFSAEFRHRPETFPPDVRQAVSLRLRQAGYTVTLSQEYVDHGDSAAPARVEYALWEISW